MRPVTAAEMKEIDRRATEEFGIPGMVLMELAGKAVADEVLNYPSAHSGAIAILCGAGNNGGDGLVAARHLHNKNYRVNILLLRPADTFKGDSLTNYKIVQKLGIPVETFDSLPRDTTLIIDAMLGTGARGEISGLYRDAVEKVNSSGKPVIAVDIPSGLDADTGRVLGACVKAATTVTMAAPKKGLLEPHAAPYMGKLIIADIGIPVQLLL